jgi:hypothetical protein
MEIIVKKDISHYNRILQKYIKTRKQYDDELKKQGMVPYEQGADMAERARQRQHKDYRPTDETRRFLYEVQSGADKNGHVKLSGRQLEYMERIGVNFKRPEFKGTKGGWG